MPLLVNPSTIDVKNKKVGGLRKNFGTIRQVLTSSFRKPRSSPLKRRTVQRAGAFEDAAFGPGVWNCQILNQVVESQLFTFLWNRYHQWLSDIELIQISAFSASYSRISPRFTAGEQTGVWDCHETRGHQITTVFRFIVYGAIYTAFFSFWQSQTIFNDPYSQVYIFGHWLDYLVSWMGFHKGMSETFHKTLRWRHTSTRGFWLRRFSL